jgi:helicase
MVGEIPTKHALGKLIEYDFIDGFDPTPLGRAVTEHFLEPSEAFFILDSIRSDESPDELVAGIELRGER